MKKFLFSILIFTAISASNLHAQQDFTEIFDSIFVNINRSNATTGILYNRVLPFTNLKHYSGSNPDTADSYLFQQAYSELYNAAFDITKRLPFDKDSFESMILNNAIYVDIGILHYRFNEIDTVVAQQKLYLRDSMLYENSSTYLYR